MRPSITMEELNAVLFSVPWVHRPPLPALDSDMDVDERLEIVAEIDERGLPETIKGLFEAARVPGLGHDNLLAILAGLEYYHLPALIDFHKGE